MTILKALLLGVIQGLTEFLPVSSSGHLVIASHYLGLDNLPQDFRVSFDVLLHLGTLLAVVAYFAPEIFRIVKSAFGGDGRRTLENRKLIGFIIFATIPAAVLGALFGEFFESLFSRIGTVGILLIVTGFILFLAERISQPVKKIENIGWKESIAVGFAQALAIAPGISRSGSTISAGMLWGLNRRDAARFSFLLSIPIIAGASFMKIGTIAMASSRVVMAPVLTGFLFSVLSGYLAIGFLMRYLKENKLYPFAYYCWAVGLITILLSLSK